MKALTVWNPWAWLIQAHHKHYETRPMPINHRGEIMITSAITQTNAKELHRLIRDVQHGAILPTEGTYLYHVVDCLKEAGMFGMFDPAYSFMYGVTMCVAQVVACHKIDAAFRARLTPQERAFGDFSDGRYAWQLANVQAVEPYPVTGAQGQWNYVGKVGRIE